jgi:NAD-dependent deacetylase
MKFNHLLLERLRYAENLVFFTGAGASTESGILTFRNADNAFWVDFDLETYATVAGFNAEPKKVLNWYAQRRQQIQSLQPNPTHHVIAAWQAKAPNVTVITQNIDGFHQRAGSKQVIELHGNINDHKCVKNNHKADLPIDAGQELPRCCLCDSLIRPDVIWFNEALPEEAFGQAEVTSFDCDVFVSIGCSMEVYPAASLPISAARCGAYLVQINPMSTDLDNLSDYNLVGKSGEILPKLWEAVWGESFRSAT